MKYFFKKEWIWLSIVFTIFIITLSSLLIKTNYEVVTPASVSNVGDYIEIITDDDNDLDINTTSVFGFNNACLLNYLVAKLNPFVDEELIESYQNTDDNYTFTQGTIDRNMSIRNAIISGYEKAGYNVEVSFKGYIVRAIYYFDVDINFELNDLILKVDNIELSDQVSFTDVIKSLRENDKDKMNFTCLIKRNNKEQEVELVLYKTNDGYYSPISTELDYSFKIDENAPKYEFDYGDALGPSGGLMQSLYIYEKLTGSKLTKGLKIAGTGTVDIYGNAGLIGGIKQKIYTANANKVDIFFVPIDKSQTTEDRMYMNYTDAKKAYNKLLFSKMEIVPVSSLDDIIKYLEER